MLGRVSGSRLEKIAKDTTFCPRRSPVAAWTHGGDSLSVPSPACDEDREGPLVRISRELSPSGSLPPFLLLFFLFSLFRPDTELLVQADSELLVLLGRVISWRPTELVTVVSLFLFVI